MTNGSFLTPIIESQSHGFFANHFRGEDIGFTGNQLNILSQSLRNAVDSNHPDYDPIEEEEYNMGDHNQD